MDITLKRLRRLTIVTPLLLVIALEGVRTLLIGSIGWTARLLLDGFAVGALIIFGFASLRLIGDAHERVKRQNRELFALHAAGLAIMSDLSLDGVLDKVVDHARDLVGAKYGALSVVDEQGHIQKFITSGISTDVRNAIGPPPVGHGLLGVVLHEGQSLRLPDIMSDPRRHGFPANHPPMHSLLAVPITCKSPFLGNLYLAEKTGGGEFMRDDEETLERFAVHAAIAIDNAYLHQQVSDLAIAQERLRIAHEVHDGIAQVLGYVNTKVQAATMYMQRGNTDEAATQLRELSSAARDAYGDVRESIVDLRTLPSPQVSFAELLREYIARWKEQTGVSTHLIIDPELSLKAAIELQLVRVVQESLTNIRKHARATNVTVDIRRHNGALRVAIVDDGVGFNIGATKRSDFPRFGLTTMRERVESIGGTISFDSTPGEGTSVNVEIPGV